MLVVYVLSLNYMIIIKATYVKNALKLIISFRKSIQVIKVFFWNYTKHKCNSMILTDQEKPKTKIQVDL